MPLGSYSARIQWEDGGTQTHDLALPFQGRRPARKETKIRWSRDGDVPSIVRVDGGRDEAIVMVKYEPHSASFTAMLNALLERKLVGTYFRNVTDFPGESDLFRVVEPSFVEGLSHAADYPTILEFDMEWRIRKSTSGTWGFLFV